MAGNNPLPLPLAAATPTLDDLIAGGNRELLQAARDIAAGAGAVSSLYLWGARGAGKSTILRAVFNAARDLAPPAYFISAAAGDALPPAGEGLLIVDDIAALPPAAQTTLFDWHNRAAATGRQRMLAAGECAAGALPVHGDLVSRLAAGLAYRIQPLTDDEKKHALEGWAKRHGFALPPDTAQLLLTTLPRGMHTLTAALAALDAFLLAQKKPLTPRQVRAWLSQDTAAPAGTAPTAAAAPQ